MLIIFFKTEEQKNRFGTLLYNCILQFENLFFCSSVLKSFYLHIDFADDNRPFLDNNLYGHAHKGSRNSIFNTLGTDAGDGTFHLVVSVPFGNLLGCATNIAGNVGTVVHFLVFLEADVVSGSCSGAWIIYSDLRYNSIITSVDIATIGQRINLTKS